MSFRRSKSKRLLNFEKLLSLNEHCMLWAHEIWTTHIELIRVVISFANKIFFFSLFFCVYTTGINSSYSLKFFLPFS